MIEWPCHEPNCNCFWIFANYGRLVTRSIEEEEEETWEEGGGEGGGGEA